MIRMCDAKFNEKSLRVSSKYAYIITSGSGDMKRSARQGGRFLYFLRVNDSFLRIMD